MRKPRPTKFIQGAKLRTIQDLLTIHHGNRPWVYWHGRPKHTSWLMNMSVGVIANIIACVGLHEANLNPAYKEKKTNAIPF